MILLSLLSKVLLGVLKKVLLGLVSEKLLVKLLFWLLSQLVTRTDNSWDDQSLAFLKEAYSTGSGEAAESVLDELGASVPKETEVLPEASSDTSAAEMIIRMNS